MMQELAQIDLSYGAVIALLLFFSTFIIIVVHTLLKKSKVTERQSELPLNDGERNLTNESE